MCCRIEYTALSLELQSSCGVRLIGLVPKLYFAGGRLLQTYLARLADCSRAKGVTGSEMSRADHNYKIGSVE